MQVSLERRPGSVVELSIEVPTERVERAIEEAFAHMAPAVKVAGFRPGKAPRAVIEREIGWPALREHALEHLLPDAISEAVAENNLQVIATPEVEVETFERLQPARIKARLTVKPEVKLGDPSAVSVPLKTPDIGEQQVDEALHQIRESMAQLVPADNRPARDGDHLVIDLEVRKDGVPVDEKPSQDLELDVDKDRLLPGLYEGLIGTAKGESKEVPVHLPDDYRREDLAGQDVTFAVTVKEIKEHELPPLDDELARTAGAGDTLGELKARLKERLQVAAERDAIFAQQKASLESLVAASEVEVPAALVDEEIDREIRNLAVSLGQQGVDFERLVEAGGANLAEMREERREPAVARVREELILDALAEQQGIVPTDEYVEAEARRSLEGAEDADRLVSSDRVRAYVRERLRLQWALLWLAAKARGEEWSPPAPGTLAAETAETAAAAEITEVPPEPLGAESAVPGEPEEVQRDDGMVDI